MSTTARLSTENESGRKGPADSGPLLFCGQTMVPEEDDVYCDVPGVASVRWDADGQLVLVEWRGWANAAEFAALLEAEITALRKHRGKHMLADCRLQKGLTAADQTRANENWLPRALVAGLKRLAVVLPSSGLAAANLKERLGKVRPERLVRAPFSPRSGAPGRLSRWIRRQTRRPPGVPEAAGAPNPVADQ